MKAPRVTLDQWRTLQAVVDNGGFAQAAEALHRSQSSVSYTVARMQEQLGVPLLRIEGRKAVLTEAGAVLLRRSRHLLKQASQIEDLAHQLELGWEAEIKRCQTIPGIGPLTAVALVACFHRGDFQRSDQWVAYMGLDVRVRDSGKCKGRRKLSKRGNPELRRLLFNGAMSAAKMPSIRPRYERHRAKGLSSTAALVAMSRKLARVAFAVLSKNEAYDEKLSNWACVSP